MAPIDQQPPTEQPVSVVVVNFNAGGLLLDCLRSVLSSRIPVELILCDNASTDGSLQQAAAAFPQIRVIRNRENLGFARAANQGLREASGTYLLLLNPDCVIQPDTLERMREILEANPRAGMAGCRILNPDGSEQRGCRRRLPTLGSSLAKAAGRQSEELAIDLHELPLPDRPQPVEAISGAFMLVRQQALEDVGL
ncbi:MAG TPA: glycosyltransferase family 2 protein, partial [Chromatiaceae bacterium]|nr:glycosyltransferase family 2 protein [Chromatiaceae bacterium]